MKKILCLTIIMSIMCCAFVGCGSSSSSKLVGNWICEEVHDSYPDQMTLYDDGTGVADGMSCSWMVDEDKITLNLPMLGTKTYNINFEGSTLYLNGYGYTKAN